MSGPTGQGLDADRFDRFRRIDWWKQDTLASARVLVVGAGALGNEILKNLALLGVGNIFVVDLDNVEVSNLSRSILFREKDRGRSKAKVAAEAIREVYPGVNVGWLHGDLRFDLGLGVYRWADVVIAGMDNREARLWINRCCWKTNTPWVDGATEVFQGVMRVFAPPDGPCYECTLSAAEFEMLNERQGCWGMRPVDVPDGIVPTTPVTSSVIAALECQEAVKLLHGMAGFAGKGFVFNGIGNNSYVVSFNVNEECNSHETFKRYRSLNRSVTDTTLRELLNIAAADLGPEAQIDFNQMMLFALRCAACAEGETVLRPRASVPGDRVYCPKCGAVRLPESSTWVNGSSPFLDQTFAELGVPPFDIVAAHKGNHEIAYEFAADAPAVLGPLWRGAVEAGGGIL